MAIQALRSNSVFQRFRLEPQFGQLYLSFVFMAAAGIAAFSLAANPYGIAVLAIAFPACVFVSPAGIAAWPRKLCVPCSAWQRIRLEPQFWRVPSTLGRVG